MCVFLPGLKERRNTDFDEQQLKPTTRVKMKLDHAYAYICREVKSDIVDHSALMGQSSSVYLPYRRLSYFFGEYQYFCALTAVDVCEVAGQNTFNRAFLIACKAIYAQDHVVVKFNGGKGKCSAYMSFTDKANTLFCCVLHRQI